MWFKGVIEYYPLPLYLMNQLAGRVAERFKAAASKAVEGLYALREFESHPFRHLLMIGIMVESLNGKKRPYSWPIYQSTI